MAYINGKFIGEYVYDGRYHDKLPTPITRIFLIKMGFKNLKEYVGSIPGYTSNTKLIRWKNGSETAFEYAIDESEAKKSNSKQTFKFNICDEASFFDPSDECKNNFFYGNCPFILPSLREMARLYRYLRFEYGDLVFSCCKNWVERDD